MRRQAAALLVLVFVASRVSGRPADAGGTSAAKSDQVREETLARLLREELRTLEGSAFPMSGLRRDSSAVAAVVASEDGDPAASSTHIDGPRDASVDLAAVPESTGGNRVSSHQQYEVGRSLGNKDSTPSEEAIVQQRPPPYRDSDHLAEKRALPPHVVKARSSGDGFMKIRSRSRPVYKPLYSSSEHLAARPAIPLPQIEAYLSSKAAESIAVGGPSLLEEAKEDAAAAAVTQVQELQGLSTVFPPRFSSTKAPFQTSTVLPFVPKSTAAPLLPELVQEPVAEKPVLLHAAEELVGEDTVLHPSSKDPPVPSASTTEATRVSDEVAVTQAPLTTTQEPKLAVTPQKPAAHPSVDENAPLKPKEQPVKSVTTAPSVSFPTNLYLPDALVLSNQHSKPQHSRFSPATVPSRRTPTPTNQDDHKTSVTASSTRAPPPFPPRRRMTFQPFRKTTPTPPVDLSASTVPTAEWQKESPVPPHYAANDDLDVIRRKEPQVRPVPDTTKNLFVSTEPSANTQQKFPEVPDEQDDDHHVGDAPYVQNSDSKGQDSEQAALPSGAEHPLSAASTLSSEDEFKRAPSTSNLDGSPGNAPVPAADTAQAKPFHYGLDEEVAPAVVADETSVGDAVVPSKASTADAEEESSVSKPAPDFTSGSDEGSLGLPGSISDQQSALEILEQLHKAEEAPIEEPAALADPQADVDSQSSFNIDDMMVSLAMGEGEGSDTGGEQAPSAPQAPAHLTDMEGRVIY